MIDDDPPRRPPHADPDSDRKRWPADELAHAPRFSATGTYIHDFGMASGAKLSPRATVHYETKSYLTYFDGDDPARYDVNPGHVSGNNGAGYGKAFDEQGAQTYAAARRALRDFVWDDYHGTAAEGLARFLVSTRVER